MTAVPAPDTVYQRVLAGFSPMNPLHLETLAFVIAGTLDAMPRAFFADVAALAAHMGPEKLAAFHESQLATGASASSRRGDSRKY